jgi:putative ATP-dependent endonuclease of OLD family
MRLKEIEISNFKGLQSASLELGPFGCLVGENNAGKSTVPQAIVYGLNRGRPAQLQPELFYDAAQPIVFALDFEGVRALIVIG